MTAELGIGGGIGLILLGVIAYFLRSRDARLTSVEKITGDARKDVAVITGQLDTISKRLEAGTESFKEITNTQRQLHENQTYIITHYVENRKYEKDCDRHSSEHERLETNLEGIKDSVADMKETIRGMDRRLEGGIDDMRKLLAKVVEIPRRAQ